MPAAEELPSVERFVAAFQGGLVSELKNADTHQGAVYDAWNGVGALFWRRLAERDKQEFEGIYFNTARDTRLDEYIAQRWPEKARVLNAPGAGIVRLSRPNAAAGAGKFWAKTRIAVGGAGADPVRYYFVTRDTSCDSAALTIDLDVQAKDLGPGASIRALAGDRSVLRFEDPLWDPSWAVVELRVEEGTQREEDPALRARVRTELFSERFGYESAIIKKLALAGAGTVVLFRSDFLGEALDAGMNYVLVGDANFETSAALLTSCRLAVDSVAMCGTSVQVLPVTTVWVDLDVTVGFWDSPAKFDGDSARANAQAAAVDYFETLQNPFLWDMQSLRGAVRASVEDTQRVDITASYTPPTAATFLQAYPVQRFRTSPDRVQITLAAPAS